ncbi:MAG: tetratricopeptide repeat protein, partial [Pseudomonadales bacterium]|nr:tetratricopeptide repeat protein [Pseudomonadales bacterium]
NFTGDPGNEYISDGLSEEILDSLTRVPDLKVLARSASFYYKGKQVEPATIAEQLSADYIIEGSIRSAAPIVRVAVQLIDMRTQLHLWSKTYDLELANVLDMQRDVANRVAQSLNVVIAQEKMPNIARPRDNQTYRFYLEGREILRSPRGTHDLKNAISLFEQAIDLDPDFTLAHVGLCEAQLARYRRSQDPAVHSSAVTSCLRVVAFEDKARMPEVFVALGNLNRFAGNLHEAELLLRRALDLAPNFDEAIFGLARTYRQQGKIIEAEELLSRTIELYPGYFATYYEYGLFLFYEGRFEEAAKKFQQVVALQPEEGDGWANRGTALFEAGNWSAAEDAWRQALNILPFYATYLNLGNLYYYRGNYEQAVEAFSRGTELAPDVHLTWGKLAAAYRYLPDEPASRAAYEKAARLVAVTLSQTPNDYTALSYASAYQLNLGHQEEATRLIGKALEIAPDEGVVHYFHAIERNFNDDVGGAVDALVQAVAKGYSITLIGADPQFENLVENEDYQRLTKGAEPT